MTPVWAGKWSRPSASLCLVNGALPGPCAPSASFRRSARLSRRHNAAGCVRASEVPEELVLSEPRPTADPRGAACGTRACGSSKATRARTAGWLESTRRLRQGAGTTLLQKSQSRREKPVWVNVPGDSTRRTSSKIGSFLTAVPSTILKNGHWVKDSDGKARESEPKLHAQRGARTHDPEIKSLMLYRLS